jgi:cytochrome c biogenesis protein CcdA
MKRVHQEAARLGLGMVFGTTWTPCWRSKMTVRLEEQEPHSQKCSTRFCALEVSFKGAAMSFFKGVATAFFTGAATSSFKGGCEVDGCETDDCEPGDDGLDSIMNILPSRR